MTESQSFTVGKETATAPEAGQSEHPELVQSMQKIQATLNAKVEEVRNNPDIDEGERFRTINSLWNQAQQVREDTEGEYKALLEARMDDEQKKLFYTLSSEKDAVRGVFNELNFTTELGYGSGDVEAIETSREELIARYDYAEKVSDRAALKALFHIGLLRGIPEIRDRYLQDHPEKQEAWQRYNHWGQKLNSISDPKEAAWKRISGETGSLVKPPELR